MQTLYHVSPKWNLKSIMEKGLIPKIGPRSKEAGEKVGVFLFPTIEDMETALGQWLSEWFSESARLMALVITVPDDFPIENGEVRYEKVSRVVIPPKHIRFLRDE